MKEAFLVGEKRLELLCLAAHAPKACVYTNSTTRPCWENAFISVIFYPHQSGCLVVHFGYASAILPLSGKNYLEINAFS